jgi:uncharacterized SAM-binding protein YcdF (DUF218 family)
MELFMNHFPEKRRRAQPVKLLRLLVRTPRLLRRQRFPVADAIVVMGAAVWAGGTPSPALFRRALHGVRVCRERNAAILLLTGGVGRHPPSEASVMREIALSCGIQRERIVLEEDSTTTYGSTRRCSRILHRWGHQRIVVVTDAYHLFRTVLLFLAWGFEVEGVATPENRGMVSWPCRLHRRAREAAALTWYLFRIVAGETVVRSRRDLPGPL